MSKADVVLDKMDFAKEFDVLEIQKNKAFDAFNKVSKSLSTIDASSKHANAYLSSLDAQVEVSFSLKDLSKITYTTEFDRLNTIKKWAKDAEKWAEPFGSGTAYESMCRTAYAEATKMQIKVGRTEFTHKNNIGEIGLKISQPALKAV